MAVPLLYWFLFWYLLCFCIRDVTCLCNVTCTTDYKKYLECACAVVPSPGSVGSWLEAKCSGEDSGELMDVVSSCALRPPQSSCRMFPQNFSMIRASDTVCNVTVTDPLGPPTGRGVESASWFLGDIVKTLPPSNLRVRHHAGSVNLTWEVDNDKDVDDVHLRYRVRIRDPTQVRIFEELHRYLVMDASSLLPGRRSQADVQACPSPESYLLGPWSAWSPPVDLTEGTAVDLTEVLVPVGGETRLVLCVAIPALLCVIALCYVSKPFFMKKVQVLMVIPDPSSFFKPLHDKCNGNFKEWVRPAFSEAEVLRVAPAPTLVPAGDQMLLLLSHHGNRIKGEEGGEEEEEEDEEESGGGGGGCNDQECQPAVRTGLLSLRTVVLWGGGEGDEGPPDGVVRGCGGGGGVAGWGGGGGGAGLRAQSALGGGPAEASPPGRGPWREELPPSPALRLPSPGGLPDHWDDDYPRVDLDTVDSGFGESSCSSPVCSEGAGAVEAGFFPADDHAKSNYVRQWIRQQPPPTEQHHPAHPPPAPAYQHQNHQA